MKLKLNAIAAALVFGSVGLMLAAPNANAAPTCDLSASTGQTCTIDGAIYRNPLNDEVVGSGVIDPFLTVQKKGTESGFSTDAASNVLPLDVKRAGGNQFTRTFTIGDLFTYTEGGIDYFRFFLDINEISNDKSKFLMLDLVKIYNTGSTAAVMLDRNVITSLSQLDSQGWSLLYDLDAPAANQIKLNYDLNSGSGKGIDLEVLIPKEKFTGPTDTRIVFASAFSESDSGFEEWWVQTRGGGTTPDTCPPGTVGEPPDCEIPPVSVPEPGGLALLGLGMFGLAAIGRRRAS